MLEKSLEKKVLVARFSFFFYFINKYFQVDRIMSRMISIERERDFCSFFLKLNSFSLKSREREETNKCAYVRSIVIKKIFFRGRVKLSHSLTRAL